ncbi:hypothetical protein Nepgr_011229 [Nepenthes gracilis]|uniref:TIR domain-containing protein n=1 Tax=Nepenthes gracilis TaxID=150966 RepID=A0AAD3XLS1_NEPGR|nr:hypothetical protein Nepgr_011229 [Nepenthes gracilis]
MDLHEESLELDKLAPATSRRLSSASSAFYSANQSPFFSPRSPKSQLSEPNHSGAPVDNADSIIGIPDSEHCINSRPASSQLAKDLMLLSIFLLRLTKLGRNYGVPFTPSEASLTSSRVRNCDVYIGLHGRKTSLLRFANWFQAELEIQGISCFASDRARIRQSRKHRMVERAMDASSFGVVIVTSQSFQNPYTIEELRFFSNKKNLVPMFFDLGPGDCLVRDIVEKRGDKWEKLGGELWTLYGGLENEWKEAVYGLSRVDEWKLEAQDGNWRECILTAVTLLAIRLGRRSVVEQVSRWRQKVKEEFPFPRDENFIGRKKELSDLEFILFGDVTGDSEKNYFDLKAWPRRKNLTLSWSRSSSFDERRRQAGTIKGKEPIIWKESEKEIEMQSMEFLRKQHHHVPRGKSGGKYGRRKRSNKIVYGKGIACVSGESGIGKTQLLLEFAYRNHQRYKMVLWIGGESRYLRQNYLNLCAFLEVDVGIENCGEKSRVKSFEEQEEAAIFRVRRELMRNIPYLVIIDNLESEKDWWDQRLVMDLLPRFGSETHFIISTRMPQAVNLEPMRLSYLSGIEAMSLMQGCRTSYPLQEIDALRVIEEKLGRITLGLAIVGAILSELPINPTRLLDTINRIPLRDLSWSGKEGHKLRRNTFLLQLFEVCFSIFDHADGPRSLATRMVQASGWFAPAAIPVSLLALAANKIPEKHKGALIWKRIIRSFPCGFTSYTKRSEAEAASMLLRFNIARSSTKQGCIHFNELIKLYARRRGVIGSAQAMARAVISRASVSHHSEHLWAACFLVLGFGNDPILVDLKASELLVLVKEVVLPLAIRTFVTFSRCDAALELLRSCTDALEAADQAFVAPVEKWLDKSLCWRPIQTTAQLNPRLWQDLALARATVLETRAKLMLRGGLFDISDDLIRKAIFIRTSICGENHPDTISSKETLSKLTRLLANVQAHTSP